MFFVVVNGFFRFYKEKPNRSVPSSGDEVMSSPAALLPAGLALHRARAMEGHVAGTHNHRAKLLGLSRFRNSEENRSAGFRISFMRQQESSPPLSRRS
jgi:hypothetical protein